MFEKFDWMIGRYQELGEAVSQPEVERQLKTEGNQSATGTPDQLMQQITTEMDNWKEVVSDARLKAD